MDHNKAIWIPFWVLILLMIMGTMLIYNVKAENDCLDYALETGEPVILIGKHPFFYGCLDSGANHYMNYEVVDNRTLKITNHKTNTSYLMAADWEKIRPYVYTDGFIYIKLFVNKQPQRYWRKMI